MAGIRTFAAFCVAVTAASTVSALTIAPAGAASSTTRVVGSVPATYTPWLLQSAPGQQVRQIAQCGGRMYAVGKIRLVGQGGLASDGTPVHTYHRGNAISFSATTGAVTHWNPKVRGEINSIAFSKDCKTAYLGGKFTKVHGMPATNIAAVSTNWGAVRTRFRRNANNEVDTVRFAHGRLFVGGAFTWINNVKRPKLASLNRTTGKVTRYAHVRVTGAYPNTFTRVYNSQVSHDGKRLLIEGVFTAVGGQPRQQMAVLDFTRSWLKLDKWTSSEFNRACQIHFYVRAGAWSPNDSTIYAAATGHKPVSGPGSLRTQGRRGLCDAVSAFPFWHKPVSHKWVNYTGCDSLYGVVADKYSVFITGHERWANNGHGCDFAGPTAVSRPGVGAINRSTGKARAWNPTRSLGRGGDDMILTGRGLWIASDNWKNGEAQKCGGQGLHGGICFLPYHTS